MPHEIRLFLERLFAGPTLAFADESLSFRKEFTMPSSGAAEESPEDTFTLEEIVELTEALERQNRRSALDGLVPTAPFSFVRGRMISAFSGADEH